MNNCPRYRIPFERTAMPCSPTWHVLVSLVSVAPQYYYIILYHRIVYSVFFACSCPWECVSECVCVCALRMVLKRQDLARYKLLLLLFCRKTAAVSVCSKFLRYLWTAHFSYQCWYTLRSFQNRNRISPRRLHTPSFTNSLSTFCYHAVLKALSRGHFPFFSEYSRQARAGSCRLRLNKLSSNCLSSWNLLY